MKKMKQLPVFGIALAFILTSCSVEKRVYMAGFHIDWKKNNHSYNRPNDLLNRNSLEEVGKSKAETIVKVMADEIPFNEFQNILASTDNKLIVSSSPKIKSGKNLACEIKNYKKANIKSTIDVKQQQVKDKKTVKKKMRGGGGKSQILALILCIFLGLLGIHRFYLGYTGLGILYLFTAGLFGIGWIIDLVLLIIPNGLSPKNKTSYKKE